MKNSQFKINDNIWYRQAIRTGEQFINWHYWGYPEYGHMERPKGSALGVATMFRQPNTTPRGCESYQRIFSNGKLDLYEWDIVLWGTEEEPFIIDVDQWTMTVISRPLYYETPIAQQLENPQDGREQPVDVDYLMECSVIGNLIEGLKK